MIVVFIAIACDFPSVVKLVDRVKQGQAQLRGQAGASLRLYKVWESSDLANFVWCKLRHVCVLRAKSRME